ncbi:MAG: AI-2E family transporter [Myxococcota bacterium]|nr:AI-2E family transporter [Myxococcota bacterium]
MDPAHEPPPRPPAIRIDITPRSIGLVLLAIAAVWFAFSLANVLLVVLVALILVGTIEPIINWLERHRLGRGNALALVFIAFAIVFAGLLLLTVPPLVAQLAELTTRAPAALDSLIAWLGTYEGTDSMIRSLTSLPIDDLTARAGRSLLGYSTAVLTAIGYALTTMFLAIYLLADPLGSKGIVFAVVTRRHHVKLARILYELKVIVGGYMRGQLITSAAITVFVFIVLSVLRVENALAIAIFAGLTDVIPFVGGLIASAPVIAAVAPRGIVTVLVVAAVMFVYQEFETRILVPRVYGRVLRLSPAIVLVALLVGGTLMGILGALLALPIAAGVRMLVRELRVELPGAAPADESIRALDEKAEDIYEQLSEGATAADAAVIAGDLAMGLKRAEDSERAASEAERDDGHEDKP